MTFDVYFPFKTKSGKIAPGVKPVPSDFEALFDIVEKEPYKSILYEVGEGKKERKSELPCVCWVGKCQSTRKASAMVPTQFVMIDIDHTEDPDTAWVDLSEKMGAEFMASKLLVAHITPSLRGLRLIFAAPANIENIEACMDEYDKTLQFGKYGDYDTACKDLSRLSFLVPKSYLLYFNRVLAQAEPTGNIVNPNKEEEVQPQTLTELKESSEEFTDDEKVEFESMEWRGFQVKIIIDKYVEVYGKPSSGEIHNYYNEMVKNFRCLTSNNKRCLLYLLPRFGHTAEECWSSIKSICRVNTLSSLPKEFYFFLKDNGFYVSRKESTSPLKAFMLEEKVDEKLVRPWMPPIIREIVSTAPDDFVIPVINSLMPILGTLTSYVKGVYPYDNREHTTSFFSVIYAPPGTGKGFVERFMDLLFEDIRIRDFVQQQRENVYLRVLNRKSQNDKSPDMPHTSLRLIPPKNSEAEFLQKQQDNQGYHMFTYAAEMDSWAKGVKAAGGNKDDMIRIAWDNGEYGQQFKSPNTFKGMVNLFWNVLITGTLQQVESYFRNVENGLVTRCCFTPIENQDFVEPPKWKQLTPAKLKVIKQFIKRCDANTYESPCTITPDDLVGISDEDFDKEVDWRFKFKPRKLVDMSWLMPVIDEFHREQMRIAARDVDKARDVFRRRVGVRGFRLGLLCTCLFNKPTKRDLENCKEFVRWWMHQDLSAILKLWGQKYNEQADVATVFVQRSLFSSLGETFSRNDMYVACMKQGIKTPIRRIIFEWKKLNYIEQIDKENFKKKQQ